MRISALSEASGVPVATIKYWLREHLVPPGTPTAPNQAVYDERHLRRLRLVRALREVGDLGIGAIRAVVAAIEDTDRSLHDVLGVAQWATIDDQPKAAEPSLEQVDRLLDELGWQVSSAAPDRTVLANVLEALHDLGWLVTADDLLPYARAVEPVAAAEIGRMPAERSRDEVVEFAVIGTVAFDVVLSALRRLALEHHSAIRNQET